MAIDLSCIVKGKHIKPPRIALYGIGGIGKTTFAAEAPNPIILPTEDGFGKLDVPRMMPGGKVLSSWEDLSAAVHSLTAEDHDYQTAAIDTLDFAESLLWSFTARSRGKKDIEDFGYGNGYRYAVDDMRILLQGLDYLRDEKNMAIILIAHHEIKKFSPPDSESYDRYKLKLHDKLASLIFNWCDAVLFANYKAHTVTDSPEAFKEEGRKRAVGKGDRILYTEERPHHWAKNRWSLPPELPFRWSNFQAAIAASGGSKAPEEPKTKSKGGK